MIECWLSRLLRHAALLGIPIYSSRGYFLPQRHAITVQ